MIEYLQLMNDKQDRECTGMEYSRSVSIVVKDGVIHCKRSYFQQGIKPEHAYKHTSEDEEATYTGDINSFIDKLENTGFRN